MFKYAKGCCKSEAKVQELMSQVEAALVSQSVKDSLHLSMTRRKLLNQVSEALDRSQL